MIINIKKYMINKWPNLKNYIIIPLNKSLIFYLWRRFKQKIKHIII